MGIFISTPNYLQPRVTEKPMSSSEADLFIERKFLRLLPQNKCKYSRSDGKEAHITGAYVKLSTLVVLMTYEWGYSGGPPAVSPNWIFRPWCHRICFDLKWKTKLSAGSGTSYGYDWRWEPRKEQAPQQAISVIADQNNAENSVLIKLLCGPFFRYTYLAKQKTRVLVRDALARFKQIQSD